MMRGIIFSGCLAFVLVAAFPFAQADDGRMVRPTDVINSATLKAPDTYITLWGVRPVSTSEAPVELRAVAFLDSLVVTETVGCKIVSGAPPQVVARCTAQTGEDIGLELLSRGLAVFDRSRSGDSAFAPSYQSAEREARRAGRGIWRFVAHDEEEAPLWESSASLWVPVAGLVFILLMMQVRFGRLEALQQEEIERARRKEATLQERERYVLVTTLESELLENKSRIEAFLTIYGDMLRSLRDLSQSPLYSRAGDTIQKHPALSRTVFDASASKLSLLEMKLVKQLSQLYAALPQEQEYFTIEPDVSRETAVALVEKILREAEALLTPINAAVAALVEVVGKRSA